MLLKVREFKIGDEVIFYDPPPWQIHIKNKKAIITKVYTDSIGTEFLTVHFIGYNFPVNKVSSRFRHLTKLELALA